MQTIYELPASSDALEVHYPQMQVSLEPEQDVQDWELNKVQWDSLKAMTVFHSPTADLLLRYLKLSPNSISYLQKHLNDLCPEKEEDRFVEITMAAKAKESRFGSGPNVYRLGKRGHA